jgi:hypothetical protein
MLSKRKHRLKGAKELHLALRERRKEDFFG